MEEVVELTVLEAEEVVEAPATWEVLEGLTKVVLEDVKMEELVLAVLEQMELEELEQKVLEAPLKAQAVPWRAGKPGKALVLKMEPGELKEPQTYPPHVFHHVWR